MRGIGYGVGGFGEVAALFAVATLLASCSPDPEPEPAPPAPAAHVGLRGRAPRASGGYPSVIMLQPEDGSKRAPEVDDPLVMDQYNTDFHPRLLIARPGQPVQFKNSEDVVHNIHVTDATDRSTIFNVATPVSGAYTHKFDREGAFDVACDIHPSMAAYIVVTSSPFVVIAETDGSFTLPDVLPAGSYRVKVWNSDPSRRLERVVQIDATTTELVLEPDSP
jgi:plastocyanin